MLAELHRIDTIVFLAINRSLSDRWLDAFFLIVTQPINYIVPLGLLGLLFLKIARQRALVVMALSTVTVILSDTLCADVLKPLFGRLRPCHPDALIAGALCLAGTKSSFAFPSAHAMNIFAQATLLARLYPAGGIFFFLFAALIGLSRIYIGVHYPLDVIGGALGGSAIGAGVYAIYAQLGKRLQQMRPIHKRPLGRPEVKAEWLTG